MNRKSLRKKFTYWSVLAAVIPVIVAAYMLYQSSDPLIISRFAVPALGYALLVGCLVILVNTFNKKSTSLAMQVETFRQETQKRNAELNALREITERIKEGILAEDLLTLIMDKAMQAVCVRNGSVFLVDKAEADGLRLIAANPPFVMKNDGGDRQPRYLFVKSVIESGKALRIQDIEKDPRTLQSNNPKYSSPSFISMPVYNHKKVIAVMNLANKENGGIFSEDDERILAIMLGAIGVGIENISLRNRIKQQLAEIKNLTTVIKK